MQLPDVFLQYPDVRVNCTTPRTDVLVRSNSRLSGEPAPITLITMLRGGVYVTLN